VANHVFRNRNRQKLVAVVNTESQADELRQNR